MDVGCPRPPLKLTWETQPIEKSSHKMLWSSEDNLDTKFFFLGGGGQAHSQVAAYCLVSFP